METSAHATSSQSKFRSELSSDERAADLEMRIDPGLVNHRRIQTVLGQRGMDVVNDMISRMPEMPGWQQNGQIDRIYTQVLLLWCKINKAPSLRSAILNGSSPTVVTSTEVVGPCRSVYTATQGRNTIRLSGFPKGTVSLEYSTDKIRASTTRSDLHHGFSAAFVGILEKVSEAKYSVTPLILGRPWLYQDNDVNLRWPWHSWQFFEHFVEDFDQFAKIKTTAFSESHDAMRLITERAFKAAIAKLLGDSVSNTAGFPKRVAA